MTDLLTYWPWLRVFLLAFVTDILWAACVANVANRHPGRASIASGLLTLISVKITVAYIADNALAWPAVLGAIAGTYAIVYWTARRLSAAQEETHEPILDPRRTVRAPHVWVEDELGSGDSADGVPKAQ